MKIYTRTGDHGSTGLFAGSRVSKDHQRIEAYGTVDELNSVIGLARSSGLSATLDQPLEAIQGELFSVGAELATPDPEPHGLRLVGQFHVDRMERWIDEFESELPPLKKFILPAGSPGAAQLHVARAVCRRAERRVVTMSTDPNVNLSPWIVIYLNRLSDLLFVMSRLANQQSGTDDVPWSRPSAGQPGGGGEGQ